MSMIADVSSSLIASPSDRSAACRPGENSPAPSAMLSTTRRSSTIELVLEVCAACWKLVAEEINSIEEIESAAVYIELAVVEIHALTSAVHL
jgi:hypothetical protein